MNCKRLSDFGCTITREAADVYKRHGSHVRLVVTEHGGEPKLSGGNFEPSAGDKPQCWEHDVAFYFDDETEGRLSNTAIVTVRTGTSQEAARKSRPYLTLVRTNR